MRDGFKPAAAIFDFDGTLADSMWVWDEVDREFARRRDLPFSNEDKERIAALDGDMETFACDYEKLSALVQEKEAAQAELDALYERWEQLSGEAEG